MSHAELSTPAARQSAEAVLKRRSSVAMQTGRVARWPYFFVLLLAVLAIGGGFVCAVRGSRFNLTCRRARRSALLAAVSANQALSVDDCLTDDSADRLARIGPILFQVAVVESPPDRATLNGAHCPLTCASNSGAPWCARE
jgi:hypothetical protein